MKKEFGKYYIGLDMGTDSLGWAVTDLEYRIPKLNGKALWGVHLFESGKTAQERRLFRSARRRTARQKQRVELLQEIFAAAIFKKDPGFYYRLADSFFLEDDKTEKQPNTLFNDPDYTDKDYHKQYPTIYHLRKAFIDNQPITDPRLLYLAIAHIIKNRGHFLFQGQKMDAISDFDLVFSDMLTSLREEMDLELDFVDSDAVKNILKNRSIGVKERQKELLKSVNVNSPEVKEIITLLCGGTANLEKIFETFDFSDSETKKLTFSDGKFDEKEEELSNLLQDRIVVLERIKAVYDWSVLADILHGRGFLSEAKIDTYEKHKQDLKILKHIIKKYAPDQYQLIFCETGIKDNYPAYIGMSKKNGKKQVLDNSICLQEDICKFLAGILSKINYDDDELHYLKTQCESRTLLPKQVTGDNSVIPYQVNQIELSVILNNAAKHFSFLSEKDADGFSNREKIEKIFLFRVPYYVGPLNDYHKNLGNCWIVKKCDKPIRPWNFDQIVDKEASGEMFITNLTNMCTYLAGKKVLPKESLLYSKYLVLNELNNLRIDGKPVEPEIKKKIYHSLFLCCSHVTQKKLRDYLLSEGMIEKNSVFSGIDGDFKASLKPWIDFRKILADAPLDESLIEEVILSIVLFSGTDLLDSRLEKICKGKYSDKQINQFKKLRYKEWGRLSKEFLTEIYHVDKQTGECRSIISMLESTTDNLEQLLSDKYDFRKKIEQTNLDVNGIINDISYNIVKDLYISPAIRRSLWRTLVIVKELRKVMGHDPEKVFIEVAREEGEKKRTISRKNKLLDLYKACREDEKTLIESLGAKSDNELRSDRLYLFYTQMGRCMYSGEKIDITQLYDQNIYDIDHIFPQSKTKDDSLTNRVLVRKDINGKKGDSYPLPVDIQQKNRAFWLELKSKGFINQEKYDRLVRNETFSENELAGFISRQLVETRQSTKAAAQILGQVFPKTEIVYVKAGNVSDFRQKYSIVKVREVNDLHHAKDAYLNIVVGNVYNTKFTHDPRIFFRSKERPVYSLNRMFDFDVSRNGVSAWVAQKDGQPGTIALVKKITQSDNILFTRYSTETRSEFFKQNILKSGHGQFPIKSKDPRFSRIDDNGNYVYGGYDKVAGAYAFFVEHTEKRKLIRTIEFVPVYLAERIDKDPDSLLTYACEELKLESPRILVKKINFNSLIEIDGFPMHLSGRTGNNLTYKGALQLHLSDDEMVYIKKICKFYERQKENKACLLSRLDSISTEDNLKLYDMFIQKLERTAYSVRLKSQVDALAKGREVFLVLSNEEQCILLYELLKMFKCTPGGSNLSLIKGPALAGRIQTGKKYSAYQKVLLIDQSPTGLFEKVTDLLAL